MDFAAVPHSSIDGIAWPALPSTEAARLLTIQYQLEQSQWWSPERHLAHQLRQLKPLLEHAWRTVPFYRAPLDAAGYRPGQEVSEELWRRLPILTRGDVRNADRSLLSTEVPAAHGGLMHTATSGSTGTPIDIWNTHLGRFFWLAFGLRDEIWHCRDWRGKLAVIRWGVAPLERYPAGQPIPNWGPPVATVFNTGPAAVLDIRADVGRQVEWLRAEDPEYLLTFGRNLGLLAAEFCARRWSLPRLRRVRSVVEIVDRELRRICREAWGVEIVDTYSCEEAGYLAFQCPDYQHLHVQMESCLVEILNASGDPCTTGETGRVVVTPLHNYAMPLVRYDLGDFAEVGSSCPCGRGLTVLRRVVGRDRDVVRLPSGETRLFLQGDSSSELAAIEPIRRYQVAQTSLEELEVRLVAARPLTGVEEEAFRQAIIAVLGYAFRFRFVYVDDIPRAPRGKYFVFRSEISG